MAGTDKLAKGAKLLRGKHSWSLRVDRRCHDNPGLQHEPKDASTFRSFRNYETLENTVNIPPCDQGSRVCRAPGATKF